MKDNSLTQLITEASKTIGKTWPLYAFVTSNPLAGYEDHHFKMAVDEAASCIGGNLYPDTDVFEEFRKKGEIDEEILTSMMMEEGFSTSPQESLSQMRQFKSNKPHNKDQELNRMVVKWLMAFLDEGLAEWEMPFKNEGFYQAWRKLASYDDRINRKEIAKLPEDSHSALIQILENYTKEDQHKILKYHIAALAGWAGYIKFRTEENSPWQQKYSLTLQDYLAVRLSMAKLIDADILPFKNKKENKEVNQLKYIWLKAWELSYQDDFSQELKQSIDQIKVDKKIPDAQMVFCIDTRSELIRRHVESKGNYETYGYAGFFGIAMDYKDPNNGLEIKSCPPILDSGFEVTETPKQDQVQKLQEYQSKYLKKSFKSYFKKRMKNMLPSAFGYVEGSGFFYGVNMLLRTLIPQHLYQPKKQQNSSYEKLCNPDIDHKQNHKQLSLEEKTGIVKSAFHLTGWKKLARLVVFAGHGSHSKNNPFASSLDCGACAASPGRHNARMLAELANDEDVRRSLAKDGFDIPADTIFIGAEHNTTTDEIVLFDSEVPDSHQKKLEQLKADLVLVQQTATQERLGNNEKSVEAAHRKTNDWSETRPEWGLAKNNAFIVGSRKITKNLNLNGHCFLHSYDWEHDDSGDALTGIMQGPMVVTQWINNHYYFSTVDNQQYGGGSKIFHNVTGKFGVVMGNGSDLKTGLPLQSVKETDEKIYHRPLRLSVFIHAPKNRVLTILQNNENLRSLLDNEWIYLIVVDPTEDNNFYRYQNSLKWGKIKQNNLIYTK
jgi:uncharacterized protein YbcC (UPF0753/DUF2309 family)